MLVLLVSAKSDSELIERVIAGDEKACSLLYKKYHIRLKAYVRGLLHDTSYVEDVVQETFGQVFRYLHSFRQDSTLFTWMCTIAKNIVFRMKAPVTSNMSHLVDTNTPESTLANLDVIEKWLTEMSDKQRTVVSLHYFNGLTSKEISCIIPMKRRAILTMLWRAKQRLKGMMYDE